jgi:hypothetical protein
MDQADTLRQLKSLRDRVESITVRIEELPERIPFHLHPESLNYAEDLMRAQDEYNRLAIAAVAGGVLGRSAMEAEGLPAQVGPAERK